MNMDIEDQCQFVVMSTLLVIFRRQLDDPNMTPKCPDLPKSEGNAEDTDDFFSSQQTRGKLRKAHVWSKSQNIWPPVSSASLYVQEPAETVTAGNSRPSSLPLLPPASPGKMCEVPKLEWRHNQCVSCFISCSCTHFTTFSKGWLIKFQLVGLTHHCFNQ